MIWWKTLPVWTMSDDLGFSVGEGDDEPRGKNDRLMFSSREGSTWSSPAEIEGSLPKVLNSNLAMHGNEGLLVYTLDMDNDLSTTEDREVFPRTWNGSAWGEAVRLTDGQVDDTNPKAAYSNGEWFITWFRDGQLTYKNGLNGGVRIVTFSLTHFSLYAVGYNPVSFNDVAAGARYSKAVSFIAAREITSGTGNRNYSVKQAAGVRTSQPVSFPI